MALFVRLPVAPPQLAALHTLWQIDTTSPMPPDDCKEIGRRAQQLCRSEDASAAFRAEVTISADALGEDRYDVVEFTRAAPDDGQSDLVARVHIDILRELLDAPRARPRSAAFLIASERFSVRLSSQASPEKTPAVLRRSNSIKTSVATTGQLSSVTPPRAPRSGQRCK